MVVKYTSKAHKIGALQPGSFVVDAKSKIKIKIPGKFNAEGSCYAQIYIQSL